MAGMPPSRPGPARGMQAGIKADLQRAKETGQAYDPRGSGNAYTHNFLNQKPWHPLNFRNQMKKWEAEQQALKEAKAKEQGMAEFEAEQEAMKTMSYLSEAQQQQYKDRASIAFMYAKPPGLDAALAKEQAAAAAKEKASQAAADSQAQAVAVAAAAAAGPDTAQRAVPDEAAQRIRELDRVREDPYALMLQARQALLNSERFEMRGSGVGGQAHGGFSAQDANQTLLGEEGEPQEGAAGPGPGSSSHPGHQGAGGRTQQELLPGVVADAADLAVLAGMSPEEQAAVMRRLRKVQRRQEQERQLAEAQAVLRAAGYSVSELEPGSGRAAGRKAKKKRRKAKGSKGSKGKKRHKSGKRGTSSRAKSSSSGGSSSSSSSSSSGSGSDG